MITRHSPAKIRQTGLIGAPAEKRHGNQAADDGGSGTLQRKFAQWCEVVASLPRKQSRVLTWPVATVFGFIAQPETHIFLKPTVTRLAAEEYGFDFRYRSRPSWETYSSLLEFGREIGDALHDLRPRDLIDIQSFVWVLGSAEYEE